MRPKSGHYSLKLTVLKHLSIPWTSLYFIIIHETAAIMVRGFLRSISARTSSSRSSSVCLCQRQSWCSPLGSSRRAGCSINSLTKGHRSQQWRHYDHPNILNRMLQWIRLERNASIVAIVMSIFFYQFLKDTKQIFMTPTGMYGGLSCLSTMNCVMQKMTILLILVSACS